MGIRLAESVGKGVFMSGNVIYFTLAVGLSPAQVGLGISAASLAGFTASLLLGMVSDRIGARRLLTILFVAEAVGFTLYPLVHSLPVFFALIVVMGFLEFGTGPSMAALIGTLVPPENRVRMRAVMRTVFNIGFSIGSGIAAVAVLGRDVLDAIPLSTAVLIAVAALLVRFLPADRARPTAVRAKKFSAVRDLRFVSVVGLSSVLATHVNIVLVALPLWVLTRTSAPHWTVPLMLVLNTAFVITFQVRASRGADTLSGASRMARRSGVWLAAACGIAAVTTWTSNTVVTMAVLITALLVFSVTEVMQSASAWGMAYGLAPERAPAEYLGTFDLHVISQNVVGPALLSGIVIAFGAWGWGLIAAVVLVAAALIVPAAQRARRPDSPVEDAAPAVPVAGS
ncbi:MFS transporter [Pseudosporangium ferrugineum]|uniref:MFS transporter n=2 Tax=Pseudosporangium ferrugineum TaxID=439699 RepID=A0A2T0SEK9_9ACTN|nr:MFS transporter [Pseudosporangium ferrugineum]